MAPEGNSDNVVVLPVARSLLSLAPVLRDVECEAAARVLVIVVIDGTQTVSSTTSRPIRGRAREMWWKEMAIMSPTTTHTATKN
mmetsp:Transcript_31501/g.82315  ORF Transcript_31501/g.82315 Transcript_31501/m.82315 type:complete len:84 (+) Transcript_31501:1082-1333(+)